MPHGATTGTRGSTASRRLAEEQHARARDRRSTDRLGGAGRPRRLIRSHVGLGGTIAAMADAADSSLAEQLEELATQLAWVREYL